MVGMWLWLAIFSCVVICAIGYWLTVKVEYQQGEQERDHLDSKMLEDYPVLLNPIILLYGVFFLVTGIIIFYYWAQAA